MFLNKKKMFCLVLALVLLLAVTGGCNNSDKNADVPTQESPQESSNSDANPTDEVQDKYDFGGRTIRYVNWGHPGPTEVTPEREERIPQLEEKFNCKFEFSTIPMDQYNELFVSSTLAGNPMADIVQMHIMWFYPGLASKGFLTPLDDLGVFDFSEEK